MSANPKKENNEPKKTVSPIAATTCMDAVRTLSDSEIRRLRAYADSRACALNRMRYCADGEDLFHDGVARTLTGVRKWRPERVDLVMHLKGCVRSIANQYEKEGRRRSEKPPEELAVDDREGIHRAMMFRAVRVVLKPDVVALEVLNLLLDGHSAGSVRSILNIEPIVYNAARKRIIRCLRATFAARGCSPQEFCSTP